MALPSTNITTTLVGQAIGVSAHSVGALCTMAATGGVNGYAFKVAELGYPITDGGLIDGALPKFNIWSANSPAELSFSGNTMIWRLKRSPSDSSRYAFRLGAFGGYNHSAVAPTFTGDTSFVTYYSDNLPTNRSVAFSVNLGSYDFRNITGCFMGQVAIRRASDNYLVATKAIELTTSTSGTINVPLSSMTVGYNALIATLEFQNAVNGNWCVLQDYSFQFGITVANTITVNVFFGPNHQKDVGQLIINNTIHTLVSGDNSFILNIGDTYSLRISNYASSGDDIVLAYDYNYSNETLIEHNETTAPNGTTGVLQSSTFIAGSICNNSTFIATIDFIF